MGSIFISYSHKDAQYAHWLADSLQAQGFNVWIDARLDYGSHWPLELQKQLDACDAFLLIMSPNSYASEWVQNELQRAMRKRKPIFPLLLAGDETWLSVESTQYYDVRGGRIPDSKFYAALSRVIPPSNDQGARRPLNTEKLVPLTSTTSRTKHRSTAFLAIVGAVIALLVVALPVIWLIRSRNPVTPPAGEGVSSFPALSSTAMPEPGPTPILTSTAPVATVPAEPVASADILDAKGVPMRLVPAGDFEMGSDRGDTDEAPVHSVYLDAFAIDKYEVTNSLYRACVNAGACYPPHDTSAYESSQFADHPVLYVDWDMAKTYCEWRGGKLPTEAQWEKAARGTDGRTYPWGEGIDCSKANYLGCSSSTSNVMTYSAGVSPYGVYDMAGNVWEWVSDWYSETYYQSSPEQNPTGPDSGNLRVVRSGAWNVGVEVVRTSLRNAKPPSAFDNDVGFRCVSDVKP